MLPNRQNRTNTLKKEEPITSNNYAAHFNGSIRLGSTHHCPTEREQNNPEQKDNTTPKRIRANEEDSEKENTLPSKRRKVKVKGIGNVGLAPVLSLTPNKIIDLSNPSKLSTEEKNYLHQLLLDPMPWHDHPQRLKQNTPYLVTIRGSLCRISLTKSIRVHEDNGRKDYLHIMDSDSKLRGCFGAVSTSTYSIIVNTELLIFHPDKVACKSILSNQSIVSQQWTKEKFLEQAKTEVEACKAFYLDNRIGSIYENKLIVNKNKEHHKLTFFSPHRGISILKSSFVDLSYEKKLTLVVQLMEGFAQYHANGWTHGDIKHDNLMFDGQSINPIDFGNATKIGSIYTYLQLFYCAPELFKSSNGKDLERSENCFAVASHDIYSLGLIVFELFGLTNNSLKEIYEVKHIYITSQGIADHKTLMDNIHNILETDRKNNGLSLKDDALLIIGKMIVLNQKDRSDLKTTIASMNAAINQMDTKMVIDNYRPSPY